MGEVGEGNFGFLSQLCEAIEVGNRGGYVSGDGFSCRRWGIVSPADYG
ncbi:MAG: hypothetical protein RMK18_08870 [Armatimonadota bacterium]|nr:hypothetical protein [Armatimonadota bacterium]MCX7777870.1 hypothetical protein [Armatimonadota bacterium]MDW8025954.1 hypothetical protein [Armatimonadota bacterium]